MTFTEAFVQYLSTVAIIGIGMVLLWAVLKMAED